jgi:hypothetical protein
MKKIIGLLKIILLIQIIIQNKTYIKKKIIKMNLQIIIQQMNISPIKGLVQQIPMVQI